MISCGIARLVRILGSLTLMLAATLPVAAGEQRVVTLFAAASTSNAINEIAALYEAEGQGAIRPVFAASSTLAKQIDKGAPADLFLSASIDWMDYLAARGLLAKQERSNLLGNRLVLIAPAGSGLEIEIGPGFPLAAALGEGRLAIGDPDHVPAGLYAKAALQSLEVWDDLASKSARAANVRAALALVESGAAVAGIVYGSDAARSRKVRVLARFPSSLHPPIAYPLATVAGRERPEVARFRDFLHGPRAAEIFARHGFLLRAEQLQG